MLGCDFSLLALARRKGSPVSPVAALAPAAWYDPSDLTTLFQDVSMTLPVTADGQSVAAMRDKSGNDRHFVQSAAARRPVFHMSGGSYWLEFDGIDDSMSSTGMALSQPLRISLAVDIKGGSDYATLFGGGAAGRSDIRLRSSGAIEIFSGEILASPSGVLVSPGGAVVISALFNGVSSTITRNSVQVAMGNAGTQTLSGAGLLGCRYDGVFAVPMSFYGAVLLGTTSDTARTTVATWLAGKSGATL